MIFKKICAYYTKDFFMTLYQFLVFNKRYSEEEAREVCIRFEFSKGIKDKARKDIQEYYKSYYAKAVRK